MTDGITLSFGTIAAVDAGIPIGFYLGYIAVAVVLVVWLARTLFAAGNDFLLDVFESEEVGRAVNRLLVIGFYLLNMGYAVLLYRLEPEYSTITAAWNQLVNRLGILFLSLGVIHLLNMLVLWRVRTSRYRRAAVPAAPTSYMPPPSLADQQA